PSAIERHAGEADALIAVGIDVAVVAKRLAGAWPDCVQRRPGRRQGTDVAGVPFGGDNAKIAVEVYRRRMPQECLVLVETAFEQASGEVFVIVELRTDVCQVAADQVTDRFRRLLLYFPES